MTSLYRREIREAAEPLGLDPRLVEAMVQIESSDNPWAWNPEPRYRYLWNVRENRPFRALTPLETSDEQPPSDFPFLAGDRDQEWWGQQASWGLLQVMGAVARENGYRGPYLTALLHPPTGLMVGCRHFAGVFTWAEGDVPKALAAWNGGRGSATRQPFPNQAYVDKALIALSEVQ